MAILIANSQLGPLVAIPTPGGVSVFRNVGNVATQIGNAQWLALLAGLSNIAFALLARLINRVVPAMLLGVIGSTLAAVAFAALVPAWPALTTIPALPGALPPFTCPDLSIATVRSLFGATLVMTLLALTEAAAIARAVARRNGDALDGNQEFIGQGLANLAGAFFSAYSASGSLNRSGVNAEAGARTPLAAASAALFLVLIPAFVAPLATYLPLAVIAGLLLLVAWGLFDGREMRRIWRAEPGERVPLRVTLVATVMLPLEWAILLGIISALIARRLLR